MQLPTGQSQDVAEHEFLLDRLRLRFRSPEVERRFQQENITESLGIIRLYLAAAVALYLVFGVLDAITGDPALKTLLFIRCVVVAPILLCSCVATFHPAFPKYSQVILFIAMVSPGVGIVAMTAIMAPPFNNLYYAGLIMVVMYGSCLVRLRFAYAACASAILFLAYQGAVLLVNPIPVKFYASNNFFLVMASAVGLFPAICRSSMSAKPISARRSSRPRMRFQTCCCSKRRTPTNPRAIFWPI